MNRLLKIIVSFFVIYGLFTYYKGVEISKPQTATSTSISTYTNDIEISKPQTVTSTKKVISTSTTTPEIEIDTIEAGDLIGDWDSSFYLDELSDTEEYVEESETEYPEMVEVEYEEITLSEQVVDFGTENENENEDEVDEEIDIEETMLPEEIDNEMSPTQVQTQTQTQTISLPVLYAGINVPLPIGEEIIVSWSKISGPGNMTFSNPNDLVTNVTVDSVGNYLLRRTISQDGVAPIIYDYVFIVQ